MTRCTVLLAIFLAVAQATAQAAEPQGTKSFVYKKTKQADLELVVHYPPGWKETDERPAVVFFFGGGWTGGKLEQFEPQASHLASRGMVAARADYRVKSRHGVTPKECVEDAKSAVRWMRANANKLGVDPDRIVAAGGSAGGHIAACTAFTPGLEAEGEDAKVSSRPNALVLFNPVLRFADIPQLMGRIDNDETLGKAISPTLHLTKDSPPTLVFFGTADRLAAMGDEFMRKSKELGHRAELFTAEGQPHGFFNRPPWQEKTTQRMDEFLVSIGYLTAKATDKDDPGLDITTRKSEDRIEVEAKDDAIFLTVTSPSGIGSATVNSKDGKWPGKLVLRLRLKGLESLTISHQQVTLGASFSSHGDSEQRVYVKTGGQEKPLDRDNPYWMEIKIVGGKSVPLQSGHFEMVLPAAIFKSEPKTVTISWIDFYRG